tara:strand:+ start:1068 stop:1229 length:162 start_codon:yes stop_codon:yes gene_type:complete
MGAKKKRGKGRWKKVSVEGHWVKGKNGGHFGVFLIFGGFGFPPTPIRRSPGFD